MLNQGCFHAYLGLWAGAWLRDVEGLDRTQAGTALAIAMLGIILGTFGSGVIADRLAKFGVSTLAVAVSGYRTYLLAQLALLMRFGFPAAAKWGAFACFGMTSTLYFAVLIRSFPPQLSGRVSTALNMTIFVAAFLLQWIVGVVLAQLVESGVPPVSAHRRIMGCLLALETAALVWLLWRTMREETRA